MIGERYKIIGVAQAERIRHKRDLWTFIERSLRIKKDFLRHLMKAESMWLDQVKFELKCTPSYSTVCFRDSASLLVREIGSWGEVFFRIKEAFHTFSLVYEKSMVSTPGHRTMEVVIQPLLIRTFVVSITEHEIISILQQPYLNHFPSPAFTFATSTYTFPISFTHYAIKEYEFGICIFIENIFLDYNYSPNPCNATKGVDTSRPRRETVESAVGMTSECQQISIS